MTRIQIQCPTVPSWLKEVDDKDIAAFVAAGWVVVEEEKTKTVASDEPKPKRTKRTKQDTEPVTEQSSSGDGESN